MHTFLGVIGLFGSPSKHIGFLIGKHCIAGFSGSKRAHILHSG
jgi:hypothetical protein